MDNRYFYQDKPIFGLDVGNSSLKVMQVAISGKRQVVIGYGVTSYDGGIIKDGVIVNPEPIAKAAKELFEKLSILILTLRPSWG